MRRRFERQLGWLVDQLARNEDDVARRIGEATQHEVAEYGVIADAGQTPEVDSDTRRHLRTLASCLRQGAMPDAADLAFVAELARTRAEAGFPLEAMLQAFRVGHRVLWDWLIAQVDDGQQGDVALAITPVMHEYLDLVTRLLAQTYLDSLQDSVAEAEKARRDLFEALLRGAEPGATRAHALAMGLAADVPYVVLLATIQGAESGRANELLRRAAGVLHRRLLETGGGVFSILRDDEVVMLVPWGADQRRGLALAVELAAQSLRQLYGVHVTAGASMPCAGLDEIARGYQEARLAHARGAATGAFVALATTALYDSLLALAGPAVQRRLPPWAQALASRPGQPNVLAETLLAYLAADLSIDRTARALVVHPNTVRHRLRRLAKVTGRRPDTFYDLVELLTVMRLMPEGRAEADAAGQV